MNYAKTMQKLQEYQKSPFQIMSVYLGADGLQAPSRDVLLSQLHSLLHEHLTKETRAAYANDIARVQEFINQYVPSARSLVFFSAGDHLWEVIELEYALEPNLVIQMSPYVEPLQKSDKLRPEYLVILIDRKKAIAFTVAQGAIIDHTAFEAGFVSQKQKGTNFDDLLAQSDSESRFNDKQLQQHIDLSVQKIVRFVDPNDVSFVLIGGHKPLFKKVTESLPTSLASKVTGYFVSELNVPLQEILQASKNAVK